MPGEISGQAGEPAANCTGAVAKLAYNQKAAISGNESLVSAVAGTDAANGSYQLEILALARAHSVASLTAAAITGDVEPVLRAP